MLKKCNIVRGNDPLSVQANENATMLFQCFVRETFCTKLVAEKHKLSEEVSFVLQTFAIVLYVPKNTYDMTITLFLAGLRVVDG